MIGIQPVEMKHLYQYVGTVVGILVQMLHHSQQRSGKVIGDWQHTDGDVAS